jgi:TolB-like protein/tetratricopeptide (TPR) repeat protein
LGRNIYEYRSQVMPPNIKHIYQFGPFRLDTEQRLLMRDGEFVTLTHKAIETLCLLVENSGRILEKDEMMRIIWPDTFVEEATLAQNIFTLRRVLGETPLEVHYIETVPKRGYRFIAKVEEVFSEYNEHTLGEEGGNEPPVKSLAVFSFKVLAADDDNEYFGLGMADALITKLTNIEGITVRPTSAILKYRGPDFDICSAGRELKVQMVMQGIIQRVDNRIRVTVQLINIEDGMPLWANKFDENFSDIFTLEDTISERVVEALTLELTSAQKSQLTKRHTKNSEAYRYYLKGRYLWSKWTEDGFKKSIAFFERAIEMDPDYALSYAALADTYTSLGFYAHLRPYESMPLAKAMARKALRLDDELAEARLPLATALFFYDWDWAGAEDEFRRAIKANPTYALALHSYGLFQIASKRFDEASSMLKRALEADPVSPLIKTSAGFSHFYSGQYDEALKRCREALEEDPYFGLTHVVLADVYVQMGTYDKAIEHYKQGMTTCGELLALPYLGYAYALSGKRDEAIKVLKRLEELSQHQYVSPFSMAVVHAGLGDEGGMFAWLERAYEGRSNKLVFLGVQPIFKRFHSDSRFKSLLRRIGLEP